MRKISWRMTRCIWRHLHSALSHFTLSEFFILSLCAVTELFVAPTNSSHLVPRVNTLPAEPDTPNPLGEHLVWHLNIFNESSWWSISQASTREQNASPLERCGYRKFGLQWRESTGTNKFSKLHLTVFYSILNSLCLSSSTSALTPCE